MKRIALIGTGNVGSHLFEALLSKATMVDVYSRNPANAFDLCFLDPDCNLLYNLNDIDRSVDTIIISVSDNAISSVAEQISAMITPEFKPLVVHTSGTTPLDVLSCIDSPTGVLYPLQTFTKNVPVDLTKVHFFVEGIDESTTESVVELASLMSEHIHVSDSATRARLHVAAVFACNFANRMWTISDDILRKIGLDFSIMQELVQATINKALEVGPREGQTGPARRHDTVTVKRHLRLLPRKLKGLYTSITNSISDDYK